MELDEIISSIELLPDQTLMFSLRLLLKRPVLLRYGLYVHSKYADKSPLIAMLHDNTGEGHSHYLCMVHWSE